MASLSTKLSRTLVAALAVASAGRALADEKADHWAWKAPRRPAVPQVARAHSPIDAFLLDKLNKAGLSFSPVATREQLLRRVTFDLTGLPPTVVETDAFLKDNSPHAWEAVIDRLLRSPHYGERWGRHWLDLARYADTNGYEHDEVRPNAWRYRDYVIRSLNEDKPYDRFITEQLAGDEAYPGDREALIATGFNLLGPDMTDSADHVQRRQNTLNDMTDTAALAFLGLTVACARCHNHKFEPIPQTDYYRLQAFFAAAEFRTNIDVSTSGEREKHSAAMREYEKATRVLREIATLDAPVRRALIEGKVAKLSAEAQAAHRTAPEQRDGGQQELVISTAPLVAVTDAEVEDALSPELRARMKELRQQSQGLDKQKPPGLPVVMGLAEKAGAAPVTHLLERGEITKRAEQMTPGYPIALSPAMRPQPVSITPLPRSTGRRLALAKWVTSPDNPLTARVMVNRMWQHHFGRGIVGSTSDFGVRGERPTHPELLDWLACELVAGDWSLKRMHKLMLMSRAYQQSTVAGNESIEKDPDNRLLSRMNRLRLEGEAVRDALLAVSGRLNPKMGGPGVVPPVAAEAVKEAKGAWVVTADPKEHVRRSVYLFARRNLRHPFLEAFDLPDSNLSCPRRERSTTAPQALALLNADETMAAANALAERLAKEPEADRVEQLYRLVLGRTPVARERERAVAFLGSSPLSELARALLNTNEFVYLD